jgi:hypothetical protein
MGSVGGAGDGAHWGGWARAGRPAPGPPAPGLFGPPRAFVGGKKRPETGGPGDLVGVAKARDPFGFT